MDTSESGIWSVASRLLEGQVTRDRSSRARSSLVRFQNPTTRSCLDLRSSWSPMGLQVLPTMYGWRVVTRR